MGQTILRQKIKMVCYYMTLAVFLWWVFGNDVVSIYFMSTFGIISLCVIQVECKFLEDRIVYKNFFKNREILYSEIERADVGDGNYLLSFQGTSLILITTKKKLIKIYGIPSPLFNSDKFIQPVADWINWRLANNCEPNSVTQLEEIVQRGKFGFLKISAIVSAWILGFITLIFLRVALGGGATMLIMWLSWQVGSFLHAKTNEIRKEPISQNDAKEI